MTFSLKPKTPLAWIVSIGVAINILGMALPFALVPQWTMDQFGLPTGGGSIVWMRQAGLLLFFISLLYLPGGFDPIGYTRNAWFAVITRMTIGLYWLFLVFVEHRTTVFIPIGLLDCSLAILNGIVLFKALATVRNHQEPTL